MPVLAADRLQPVALGGGDEDFTFGSGQHGWSALSLYVLDAAAGHFYELPVGAAAQPAP